MNDVKDRRIWVLQKELEQLMVTRAIEQKEARNRIIGVAIVALIEFLWILLRPGCGA